MKTTILVISLLLNLSIVVGFKLYAGLAYDMGWSHGLERGCWNSAFSASNKNAEIAKPISDDCFRKNITGK